MYLTSFFLSSPTEFLLPPPPLLYCFTPALSNFSQPDCMLPALLLLSHASFYLSASSSPLTTLPNATCPSPLMLHSTLLNSSCPPISPTLVQSSYPFVFSQTLPLALSLSPHPSARLLPSPTVFYSSVSFSPLPLLHTLLHATCPSPLPPTLLRFSCPPSPAANSPRLVLMGNMQGEIATVLLTIDGQVNCCPLPCQLIKELK